jgi:hypothetical protein
VEDTYSVGSLRRANLKSLDHRRLDVSKEFNRATLSPLSEDKNRSSSKKHCAFQLFKIPDDV